MTYNGSLQRRGLSPRLKTFLLGTVYSGEGCKLGECVVIDFSATGAKIHIDADRELPSRLRLIITQRKLDLTCVVAYRSGDTAGLKFEKYFSRGIFSGWPRRHEHLSAAFANAPCIHRPRTAEKPRQNAAARML